MAVVQDHEGAELLIPERVFSIRYDRMLNGFMMAQKIFDLRQFHPRAADLHL
jgi:hypothetical protein